jgi:uncharacterized SAM-binding protein YcdF (DUF218 family)
MLYPLCWVFALLAIALLAKNRKRKKRLLIAAVVVLYLFSIPLFINMFARAWNVESVLPAEPKVYSCVIVLGGFSSVDNKGKGYFNGSADRFIQGIKLLASGRTKHLLITGGSGYLFPGQYREGDWARTQLKALNIPDSSVLIESNSRNTIENATLSKPILQKAGLKPPYLLVTSDFHMRRAYMIFKKNGYDVVPYPCNYVVGHNDPTFADIIPDGGALFGWNIYLKEAMGYVINKWN